MDGSEIIQYIERLEDIDEIDYLLRIVLNQRRKKFPDWDMTYLALPKNDTEERRESLKYAMELLMKENWMGETLCPVKK